MRLLAVVVLFLVLNPAHAQFLGAPPQLKPAQCANVSEVYKVFRMAHAASRDEKLAAEITTVDAFFKGLKAEIAEQFDRSKVIFTADEMAKILKDIGNAKSAAVLQDENCEVYEEAIKQMETFRKESSKALEVLFAKEDLRKSVEEKAQQLEDGGVDAFKAMREQAKERPQNKEELDARRVELLAMFTVRYKKVLKDLATDVNEEAYLLARKSLKRIVNKDDQDTPAEVMLKAAFSGADPHSDYLTDKEFRKFAEMRRANFAGLGAQIVEGGRGIYLVNLIEGGGAAESGALKEKDLIVKINGVSTVDMDPEEFRNHSLGVEGTQLEIEVLRDGKIQKATVTRRQVSQQTKNITTSTYEVRGKKIGFIHLGSFIMDNTAVRMREEMRKLGPVDGWILDLRGNAGGLINMATDVTALFVGKSKIASWQMSSEQSNFSPLITSRFAATPFDQPMAVLISNTSASASEIVSGALQMHGRALVISASETSFKKGTIQTIAPLPMFRVTVAGAMRLTTGYFYDINGQPIQNKGVTPDIRIPLADESEKEFSESSLDHTLPTPSPLAIDAKTIELHNKSRAPMLEQLKEIAPKYGKEFVTRFDVMKDDVVLEAGKEVVSDLIVIDVKKKEEAKKQKEKEELKKRAN